MYSRENTCERLFPFVITHLMLSVLLSPEYGYHIVVEKGGKIDFCFPFELSVRPNPPILKEHFWINVRFPDINHGDQSQWIRYLTYRTISMDFVPRHFLRCHSKTDKDSADVSTQVNLSRSILFLYTIEYVKISSH